MQGAKHRVTYESLMRHGVAGKIPRYLDVNIVRYVCTCATRYTCIPAASQCAVDLRDPASLVKSDNTCAYCMMVPTASIPPD